ncbi:response regulator [Sulfurovum sp. zt1-1]|uniref:Response regulator n=1 Tax=Sulfurovum zhangzhouensis TaxID=3019067 RepID=A0ABT7QWW4_9BACT|nr:response regulator [Sulfurovum zhangzhouensis]MDM5271319.1 response regulator [Sulfurovum zhangzhouensis]
MVNYSKTFSKTKDLSILLVEDYEPLRNDMAELLEDLFNSVTVASSGEEALKFYQTYYSENDKSFDLLMTDIQMSPMNGIELSTRVREINSVQQIIILSAHTDSNFLIPLINLGISHFLTKPIKYEELIDVLGNLGSKIIEEMNQPSETTMLQLGEGFVWDSKKNVLSQEGVAIELTRYELILLQLLLEKSEHLCTTEEILYRFDECQIEIGEKNIRNLVSKLRKKLPLEIISNIYGMGYKLTLKK